MKCPVCVGYHILRLTTSAEGLRLRQCPDCWGRWIRSDDYWRWRTQHSGTFAPPAPEDLPTLERPDRPDLRFCPEDSYVLARFDVGSPHEFWIDQCRTCSGVWLDAGEWEALVHTGLADRLHLILSEEWQDDLRAAHRADQEAEQWLRQLGPADLERITEIKEWLDGHPNRGQLYAFLRFHERAV